MSSFGPEGFFVARSKMVSHREFSIYQSISAAARSQLIEARGKWAKEGTIIGRVHPINQNVAETGLVGCGLECCAHNEFKSFLKEYSHFNATLFSQFISLIFIPTKRNEVRKFSCNKMQMLLQKGFQTIVMLE